MGFSSTPYQTTPIAAVSLPMGSYVAVVKKDGYRDTRYPVLLTRNSRWSGELRLATDEEIGPRMLARIAKRTGLRPEDL